MFGSQVTNTQTSPDSYFLNHYSKTKRPLIQIPSVAVMALRRNVLQQDDSLCELYADTHSDVSVYSDKECTDSDSDVPTTSSRKELRYSTGPLTQQFPHPLFLTSNKTIFITV